MEPHDPNQPSQDTQPPVTAASPRGLRRFLSNKPLLTLGAVVFVFLLLVVALAVTSKDKKDQPPQSQPAPSVEIEITKDGFSPATVLIDKGTKVTWINKDSDPHRVAANPHPEHSSLPGLDSKEPIGPNGSYSFAFDKPGTYTYHDHYNPTLNGTIEVK